MTSMFPNTSINVNVLIITTTTKNCNKHLAPAKNGRLLRTRGKHDEAETLYEEAQTLDSLHDTRLRRG